MEITLKTNYGYVLIFKDTNVVIEDDIEDRIYAKDENGKLNFKLPIKRDIKIAALEQFSSILGELISNREKEFDSSDLIKSLFEKLPSKTAADLLIRLNRDYEEEN